MCIRINGSRDLEVKLSGKYHLERLEHHNETFMFTFRYNERHFFVKFRSTAHDQMAVSRTRRATDQSPTWILIMPSYR